MKKALLIGRNLNLQDLPGEIWKPITGFEGLYEVSNYSRIKSMERIDCRGQHRKTRIRKQSFDEDGYFICCLSKNRIKKMVRPHRLSAIEFIPNPLFLPEVNHIDGVKTNCHISNLEWVSNLVNIRHAESIGLRKSAGQTNPSSILTDTQALEIFNSKDSRKRISLKYGISISVVHHIKTGYTWSSVTGIKNIRK